MDHSVLPSAGLFLGGIPGKSTSLAPVGIRTNYSGFGYTSMSSLVRRAAQQVGAGLSLSDFDKVLDSLYGGQPSYTGELISPSTALAISAVWSCITIVAGDLATLPLLTYRRNSVGRDRATDHYLWGLLQDEANPEQSAFRFKQLMQAWVMLWGNAYAEIEINGRGQVTALWPWRPDRVKISRAGSSSGPLVYTYKTQDNKAFSVPRERMLHIRSMGIDGVTGLSPIEQHRQTMGLSRAVTKHGAKFFSNGARPLGIIRHPQTLGDKAYERIKATWAEDHQGLDNAHRVAILEEGMEWKDTGANMVDAQYIETYKITAEDIFRIYNVPQHRGGLLDHATNNNISQMSLEYVLYTMMPLCANWQGEIHYALLSARELQTITTAFNFLHLLRGDFEAIGKFIAIVRQWGILSGDEVREMFLDLNPLPGGAGADVWRPVNMVDANDPAPQPQPQQQVGMEVIKQKPPADDKSKQQKTNGVAHF